MVTPFSSGGAFAAEPPHCLASRITLSATRPRSGAAADKWISSAIVGSGTYSGRPVVILIFEGGRGPVAYVVSAADCSLVRRVPL